MRVPSFDEAFDLVVDSLRPPADPTSYTTTVVAPGPKDWDLRVADVIAAALREHHITLDDLWRLPEKEPFSGPFYDAAAELCRIGILRLGRRADLGLGQPMPVADFYSLTTFGKDWVARRPEPIPRDPGQFMKVLQSFRGRLGPGFIQRAEEAIRCYRTSNYLAACVMCGAAAESILLAIATAKIGDEAKVLAEYVKGSGRKKVTDMIAGRMAASLRDQLDTFMRLAGFWRDEAGHGRFSEIREPQANMSLLQLVRFAQFANTEWAQLTAA